MTYPAFTHALEEILGGQARSFDNKQDLHDLLYALDYLTPNITLKQIMRLRNELTTPDGQIPLPQLHAFLHAEVGFRSWK